MRKLLSALVVIAAFALLGPSALAEAIQPWDKQFSGLQRFKVLAQFGNDAVLDKETGLVWEQSPDTGGGRSWLSALSFCNKKSVGNRKGWRLPTIQELASLVDPTQVNPALPSGHPFTDVQFFLYWSSSTVAGDTNVAWVVNFGNGSVIDGEGKLGGIFTWCVRGGQGVDPQ